MSVRHTRTLRIACRVVLATFTAADLRRISRPAARALWLLNLALHRPATLRLCSAPQPKKTTRP